MPPLLNSVYLSSFGTFPSTLIFSSSVHVVPIGSSSSFRSSFGVLGKYADHILLYATLSIFTSASIFVRFFMNIESGLLVLGIAILLLGL